MIALTIDVEKWPFPEEYGISEKVDTITPSIAGMEKLLDLFKKHNSTSTLFVTGDIAEAAAGLLKQAKADGHEIACHGHSHIRYNQATPEEIEKDVRAGKAALKKLGFTPKGFRAPGCNFNKHLVAALQKNKFEYDSSLHPTFIPGHYNNLCAPLKPFEIGDGLSGDGLREVPISVFPLLRFPISWLWARMFGPTLPLTAIKLNQSRGITPVLYFHPWEFADRADLPRLDGVPKFLYTNAGNKALEIIDKILSAHNSTTLDSIL